MQHRQGGGNAGKGNMERVGENVGATAGRAIDTAADIAGKVAGAAASAAGSVASAAAGAASAAAGVAKQTAGAAANLAGQAAGDAAEATALLIGNVADRLGGWWAERGVGVASRVAANDDRERACREHFASVEQRAGRDYEVVRPLYALGHVAASNPDYSGRGFAGAELDLERAWRGANAEQYGEWSDVRGFVGAGFALAGQPDPDAGGDSGREPAGRRGGSAVDLGAASGGAGVGFRGHSGGGARDSESTKFGNSGSAADGTTPTRDTSAPDSRGSL